MKTNRPIFHIQQVVKFSESDAVVFSGVSNDIDRLVKFIHNKSLTITGNNPHIEGMVIDQLNNDPKFNEITEACKNLTNILK